MENLKNKGNEKMENQKKTNNEQGGKIKSQILFSKGKTYVFPTEK